MCNLHWDQPSHDIKEESHDIKEGSPEPYKGPYDRGLYISYLRQLFSKLEHQGVVNEVFESDGELLAVSLSVLLEEGGHEYPHTHTEEGLPRYSPIAAHTS